MRKWTIRAVEFKRAQRGWLCEIAFRVPTHRQCTWEDHAIRGYGGLGRLGLRGVAGSFLDARRVMRREILILQALPGQWTLDCRPASPPSPNTAKENAP